MGTTGQIVGGIAGAVIGFVATGYNPYGAFVGFSLGMGIGSYIDPIKPDIESPGQPSLNEIEYNTSDEGVPLPDILGCTKVNGNIIWYGGDRAQAIYETQEVSGGKGTSSQEQTYQTGWKYYATWALGICIGPVDKLYTIYNGEDVVWNGELTLTSGVNSVTGETITLSNGMGSMTFYFGTDDQQKDPTILSKLSDNTLSPAYRHICYAVFNDNFIGSNSNRVPTMRFVVGKFPDMTWTDKEVIGVYDYNPAAAAYYVLNDMLDINSDYINTATFSGSAHTLWQEGLGISMNMAQQSSALTYTSAILDHVRSIIRYGNDGKLQYKNLRKDAELYEMIETDENTYLEKPVINRISWIDTINEMKVQYSKRLFKGECVKDAPTLSLVGQTSSADCEGEASFSISEGCGPFELQTKVGGVWKTQTLVDRSFVWQYAPEKCSSTTIRINDNEGQTSNNVVLAASCNCTGASLNVYQ